MIEQRPRALIDQPLRRHGHSSGGKTLSAPQHRPGDPGQLVGEGYDRDVAMGAAHEALRPSAERRVALGHIGQRGARSVDQLLAQILVAALADTQQLRLAAGGELPRNQTEPGGQIAAVVKAFRVADGGDERRRDDRAEAGDRRRSTSLFVLASAQRTNCASKAPIRRSELKPVTCERRRAV